MFLDEGHPASLPGATFVPKSDLEHYALKAEFLELTAQILDITQQDSE